MKGEIYKATITVEVMGFAESEQAFKAELSGMTLPEILEDADSGGLISGGHKIDQVRGVPRDQVADELQAIGNDGTFFDMELEED